MSNHHTDAEHGRSLDNDPFEDPHYGTRCEDNADRVGDTDVWICRICDAEVTR